VKVQTTSERVLTFWRFISFWDQLIDHQTILQTYKPRVRRILGTHSPVNNTVTENCL
jgi:hypothetical protein